MIINNIIIGAGPAGLQLGCFMEECGEDYLVLESGPSVGSFFRVYPRHRKLISINKKYTGDSDKERNLRMDWNSLLSKDGDLLFTQFSDKFFPPAEIYVKYLEEFRTRKNVNVKFGQLVSYIEKNEIFTIKTVAGEKYQCRNLIMATGVSKENIPDFTGVELCDKYSSCDIDPNNYINQRVLVLGKGNSAFETADNLVEKTAYIHVAGRSSLKLAWQTHFVGHLRAVNNNLLDTYQLKSQNAILDGNVVNVRRENNEFVVTFSFSRSDEVRKELRYDRVILCTGFRFDDSIFSESCKPKMTINNRFPEMSNCWESVNIPGLFFAGTLMQQRDYKKSTSGFVHGFRYAVRSLFNILQYRFKNREIPSERISADSLELATYIADRINRTSALWQQFQFLCDSISIYPENCLYFRELPVAYTHEFFSNKSEWYLNITLEYGPDHDKVDPFDIDVARVAQDDHENALNAQYLHPVIRFCNRGEIISIHHMAENLENEWNRYETHIVPLEKFIGECIKKCVSDKRQEAVAV